MRTRPGSTVDECCVRWGDPSLYGHTSVWIYIEEPCRTVALLFMKSNLKLCVLSRNYVAVHHFELGKFLWFTKSRRLECSSGTNTSSNTLSRPDRMLLFMYLTNLQLVKCYKWEAHCCHLSRLKYFGSWSLTLSAYKSHTWTLCIFAGDLGLQVNLMRIVIWSQWTFLIRSRVSRSLLALADVFNHSSCCNHTV